MSSKSDLKNLETQHSIRPHEIAFLVREYLKQNGCPQAYAAFLQEHPSAGRGQAPNNKKLITLKQLLDKYLEMKHKEEKMEQLVKELTQTNKMLLKVISLLEASQEPMQYELPLEMAASNDTVPAYGQMHGTHPPTRSKRGANQQQSLEGATVASYDTYATNMNGDSASNTQLAEFYQRLMTDNRAVELITEQLNQAISSRDVEVGDAGATNDSVFEQVLESDLVTQLMNEVLPAPPEIPLESGQHPHHSHQMQLYDYSEIPMTHNQHLPSENMADPHAPNYDPRSRARRRPTAPTHAYNQSMEHSTPNHTYIEAPQQTPAAPMRPNSRASVPISPLNPNPHPHFTIRTVSTPNSQHHQSPVPADDHTTTHNLAPTPQASTIPYSPRTTSTTKTRQGDMGDAPATKKRRN